jgi:hypothetical protein
MRDHACRGERFESAVLDQFSASRKFRGLFRYDDGRSDSPLARRFVLAA